MDTETKKEARTCVLYLMDLYRILWKRQRAGKDLDPRYGNDRAVMFLDNIERLEKIRDRLDSTSYEYCQMGFVILFFKGFYLDIHNKKYVDVDAEDVPLYIKTLYK